MQLAQASPVYAPTGTFAYQAPEQFAADAQVDDPEKSDVFALGGIAYWLMTRQQPFPNSPRLSDRPAEPPVIPLDVMGISDPSVSLGKPWSMAARFVISHCLAKDPRHRPSLDELLDASKISLP
jgi:serine/threonine protein kinase